MSIEYVKSVNTELESQIRTLRKRQASLERVLDALYACTEEALGFLSLVEKHFLGPDEININKFRAYFTSCQRAVNAHRNGASFESIHIGERPEF